MNALLEKNKKSSINYQIILEKEINTLKGKRPNLLLHSCCAPCCSSVLERLTAFFDLTVLYYNPNIYPYFEYEKRFNEQKKLLRINKNIDFIDVGYMHDDFLNVVKDYENEPEGGIRCRLCIALRLDKTALLAKKHNFEYITTTLSVSPHKNAEIINTFLEDLSVKYKLRPLYADFKKKNGFKRSIELSNLYDIYRQDYCGCEFSKR